MRIPPEVYKEFFRNRSLLAKDSFFGSAPAPFVGHYGYPHLNVGILSPPEQREDAWEFDHPRHWALENYTIPKIMGFRTSLVNSRFKADVKQTNKFLDIAKQVGMAAKPVDVEIHLEKKPYLDMTLDAYHAPTGPRAQLKSASVTSNPKVPTAVEKAVSDTDWKAGDAVAALYEKGIDENYLSRMFSVGTLGVQMQRKLVPTRWSITAVDDTLGKKLLAEIKQCSLGGYEVHFGGHLGNYFLCLFFPEVWGYELFEMFTPKLKAGDYSCTTDHEGYAGRKEYASETAGGYYAARLSVLEKFKGRKRQGRCLVLRFITPEYTAPLGVWVVREAVRNALAERPLSFASQELMLAYAKQFIQSKFGVDIVPILERSVLLKEKRVQRRFGEF
ncbi:hypothetical protein HZB01_04055 [Candidatus Woesearchaeota archaeon]|nr:hypothetical protein [Candidatus Woesearchaeota archaeon]